MSTSRKSSVNASGGAGGAGVEKEKATSASGGGGGGSGLGNPSSKAYSSHLAVQTDATKYRGKYKELKRKVRQIEMENDKLHFKTLRIKRNIQRMRLERAILYERLEAEIGDSAALVEAETTAAARASFGHGPEAHRPASVSQHSNSTPSHRRVIDYSPSPEDTKTGNMTAKVVAPAATTSTTGNGEARQGMKVTLKRNSHANGKDPAW